MARDPLIKPFQSGIDVVLSLLTITLMLAGVLLILLASPTNSILGPSLILLGCCTAAMWGYRIVRRAVSAK